VSRRIGSAGLYGFTATDAEKRLVVTERGLEFIGPDDRRSKKAAREGIMSTGFGSVIKRLSTRRADAEVVALRLQEDQGIHDGAASDRANLLVKAANEAGLITNGNFDGGAIEDTIASVGEPQAPRAATSNSPRPVRTPSASSDRARVRGDSSPSPTAENQGSRADEPEAPRPPIREASKQPMVAREASGARRARPDLPATSPASTKRVVRSLAELAAPATRERVASRLGVKLGGRIASTISAAVLYGFADEDDEAKLVVTRRGNALLSDDDRTSRHSQRLAIMSTGYGAIAETLRTHRADADIVAVRLQDDLGMSEGTANERARMLVRAAVDAGLVVGGRFDAEAVEDSIEELRTGEGLRPLGDDAATQPHITADPVSRPRGATNAFDPGSQGDGAPRVHSVPFGQAASAAPMQIVIHVDASRVGLRQIAELVRELRTEVMVSTQGS